MKNPRNVSRSHNPEANAVWTMEALKPKLNEYVDLHNALPRVHEESPNDVCGAFLDQFGYHYARWIGADVLQRLRQNPVKGNTRIVSDKATIRVNTIDYGSEELKSLVGEEVKVFMQKDARVIFVDDPVRKLQIICCAYTADVKHAASPEEAAAVVEKRMHGSYTRRKKADELLGDFIYSFVETEADLAKDKANVSRPAKGVQINEPKLGNGFIDPAVIASIPAAANE